MECLKEKVKDLSLIPKLGKFCCISWLSDLLKCKLEPVMSIEELKNHIAFEARKEFWKRDQFEFIFRFPS